MTAWNSFDALGRRAFLKGVAGIGGAAILGRQAWAAAPGWIDRPGLQLFTVRNAIAKDFEGTLAQVAVAGYKVVEPTSYGDRTPEQVRAILDRLGLQAPSTHVMLTPGPDLERKLAGYQAMGHQYSAAGPARPAGPPPNAPVANPAPNAPVTKDAPRGGPPPGGPPASFFAPKATDAVRREADVYNEIGRAGQPYGVKVLIHNHTLEFGPLADDASKTPFDVLLANTDPSLVVFELDIGWATVAGQNALELFRRYPGRFPLWHVKDMADLATVRAMPTQGERMRAAKIVAIGEGEINYKPIFAEAARSGLQHYYIEDDTAPLHGSLDVMRTCLTNLRKQLA